MVAPLPSHITSLFSEILDPYLGVDLVTAKAIQEIVVQHNKVMVRLVFPYPNQNGHKELISVIQQKISQKWPGYESVIHIETRIRRHKVQPHLKPKATIKNIIAVGSGKGGVGKSTVALNLALSLKALGAKVAILDADIYGPSQPHMLGCAQTHAYTHQKKLLPVEQFGIQSISIGYLVDQKSPMVWRGPMISGALQQLLNDTAWQECDYMIIDLPPGTGDIQLTLAQKVPISGAVIVTTPQDISLIDARKAYHMFQKVEIPVLGVIENMSWHICGECGHESAIFGKGGGQNIAQECDVPLLGQIPLDAKVQQFSDQGTPITIQEPEHPISKRYEDIAAKVAATLAKREVESSAVLTELVLEG